MRYFLTLILAFISSFSIATPLKNIVVFGDSLSDNGNLYEFMRHQLPKSPPYFDGRFSDGLVWVEKLTETYFPNARTTHLQDYAFGGAGVLIDEEEDDNDYVFTLRREINTYLQAHNDQADPDTMFFIWIGGNNYLGVPDNIEETVNDVISGIKIDVQRLVDHGAKNIMIMGLPDLSRTPLAKELEAETALLQYSNMHNTKLKNAFDQLKNKNSDTHWIYFDTNQIFLDIFANPGNYNVTNTTETCYDTLVQAHAKNPVLSIAKAVNNRAMKMRTQEPHKDTQQCDGYLFFDLVHPTKQVHEITARYVQALLEQENITFENTIK